MKNYLLSDIANMNFYCLHEGLYEGVQLRLDQLRNACETLDVKFIAIDNLNADYTKLPFLKGRQNLLYNCARGSQTLESILLNEDVTTFYCKNPALNQAFSTTDWSIIHDKANLLAPKTIFNITSDRQHLKNYVEYLGGFPIIIKATGSTRGIGTMKIDSWQNLVSTVDYLTTTGDKFILREFIKAKSGCRLIVLGKEIIASAEFTMNENDFRNAIDLNQVKYIKREYPEAVNKTAIKATHLANLEFSGADFLEDENGNFYLLEINFPTGFSGLIDVCDVDIPLKIVEYLKNKAAI